MAAPALSFAKSGTKMSGNVGFDVISVTFSSDIPYVQFECRATKVGEDYGVGKGALIASFSTTPANTDRTFEIYDEYLTNGDGEYRISLFAKSEDGGWNDNAGFITTDGEYFYTADGAQFLSMRANGGEYNSSHTGAQIDEAVSKVKSGQLVEKSELVGKYYTVTVEPFSWSNGQATISLPFVSSTSVNTVSISNQSTAEQYEAAQEAMLIPSSQTDGSITIKALGTVPTMAISLLIVTEGTATEYTN